MTGGASREEWTDAALSERFRSIQGEIEYVREAQVAQASIPMEVAEIVRRSEMRLGEMIERAEEARAREVREFTNEYREDKRRRREREELEEARSLEAGRERLRNAVVLIAAAMALLGTLLAALITSHTI